MGPPAVHYHLTTKRGGLTLYVRGTEIRLQSDIQIIHLSQEDCGKLIEMLYRVSEQAGKETPHAPIQHP